MSCHNFLVKDNNASCLLTFTCFFYCSGFCLLAECGCVGGARPVEVNIEPPAIATVPDTSLFGLGSVS